MAICFHSKGRGGRDRRTSRSKSKIYFHLELIADRHAFKTKRKPCYPGRVTYSRISARSREISLFLSVVLLATLLTIFLLHPFPTVTVGLGTTPFPSTLARYRATTWIRDYFILHAISSKLSDSGKRSFM